MTNAVPINDQIEEVGRELRQRERLYPTWIEAKRLRQETADKKMRDLTAAHATLAYIEKHAEPLRLLIKTLQQYNPYERVLADAVIEKLVENPGVRAVMETFPGAFITNVGSAPQETSDLFAEEPAE